MSAALIVLAAAFSVSCQKNNDGSKCPLNSLNGTSWTTGTGDQVMTLSFKENTFALTNIQKVEEITVSAIITGPYTYNNPNFEGEFGDLSIDPDVPGLVDLLRPSFPIGATLPGTVSTDGQTITTKGNTPKTFKRNN